MPHYELCLAWNWYYDADFVRLLDEACARRNLALLQVTPENLAEILIKLISGEITFTSLLDRASGSDPRFQPLADWAREQGIFCINSQEQTNWVNDKATMHLEFISRGLNTPHTIILPPFDDQPEIPLPNLIALGGRFVIKPACGGGGEGVVLEATSVEQVSQVRQAFPMEKILLQVQVTPQMLDSRPAWFRVLVCAGAIYPCWWHPQTHVYTRVTAEERARFGLGSLRQVAAHIAVICKMDLFSTEIALFNDQFIVVDYVNDPLDLRLQSKAADGAPDAIVQNIAERLARLAESHHK